MRGNLLAYAFVEKTAIGIRVESDERFCSNDGRREFLQPALNAGGLHFPRDDDVAASELVSELVAFMERWQADLQRRQGGVFLVGGGVRPGVATVAVNDLIEGGSEFGRGGAASARVDGFDLLFERCHLFGVEL